MREIRISGSMSGIWKRSSLATAPDLDSTAAGGEDAVHAGFGLEQTQRSARGVDLTMPLCQQIIPRTILCFSPLSDICFEIACESALVLNLQSHCVGSLTRSESGFVPKNHAKIQENHNVFSEYLPHL